jgi:hypothetical protein
VGFYDVRKPVAHGIASTFDSQYDLNGSEHLGRAMCGAIVAFDAIYLISRVEWGGGVAQQDYGAW